MNTNLYDGYVFSATHQNGPIREYLDPVTRSLKYIVPLRIRADWFATSNFSLSGPKGGYLIGESQPHHIGAGMVEWEQTFALVPPNRTVPETITYPSQFVTTGNDIVEIPISTVAQVTYEYAYDPSGTFFAPYRTFRLQKVGSTIWSIGTPFGVGFGLIVAQDSKIRNWAGFISERSTARIPRIATTAT